MSTTFVPPMWRGTSLDSPITKVSIPLLAVYGSEIYPSGTACIIAPWLAVTARHVVEDQFARFVGRPPQRSDNAAHETLTYVNPGSGQPAIPFFVTRTWYLEPYDIAVLLLAPASAMNPQHVWDRPRLSLLPPPEGSRVFAFGYPNSRVESVRGEAPTLNLDATTTTGTVLEVHHERRDLVRLPFPCFRTDARFDGGMSGGPVFNENGEVCGLVCSSLPPDATGGEHTSYVASLWPLLAVQVDAPWDRYQAGASYPMYEYAEAGVIETVDLDHFKLERHATGNKLVCRR